MREPKRPPEVFHSEDLPTPHAHQFTIAVEWDYIFTGRGGVERWPHMSDETPTGKRVIKLRCVCGEEVDR